jgi:hypothetical protein
LSRQTLPSSWKVIYGGSVANIPCQALILRCASGAPSAKWVIFSFSTVAVSSAR